MSSSGTLALSGTTLIGTGTVTDAGSLTTSSSSSTSLSQVTMSTGSSLTVGGIFEVMSGATLKVSSDANVQINNGESITVEAGAALTVGAASMVAQDTNNNYAEGITVDGTLTATGTAFTKTGGGVTAYIQVNPAGHLVATGTNFSWDSLSLAGGSVLTNGDLAATPSTCPSTCPSPTSRSWPATSCSRTSTSTRPTSPAGPSI